MPPTGSPVVLRTCTAGSLLAVVSMTASLSSSPVVLRTCTAGSSMAVVSYSRLIDGRGIEDSLATLKSRGFEDLYSRLVAGRGIEDSLATLKSPTGSPVVLRTCTAGSSMAVVSYSRLVAGRGIEDSLATPKSPTGSPVVLRTCTTGSSLAPSHKGAIARRLSTTRKPRYPQVTNRKSSGFEVLYSRLVAGRGIEGSLATLKSPTGSSVVLRTCTAGSSLAVVSMTA